MEAETVLFQSRAETRILTDLLRAVAAGESTTVAELSAAVGCNLDSSHHRHLLTSARRTLEREGVVFTLRRGSVQRLNAGGSVGVIEGWGASIRRKAVRGCRLSARIPMADVPERERPVIHALQATMGVIAQFTAPATARRLVAKAEQGTLPSPERLAFEGLVSMTKGGK